MEQIENCKKYIETFEKKLERVSIADVSDNLLCKEYLTHLLQHKKYYLAIYADVLNKLLQQSASNKGNISLIDFGAGNGLLGIFAKYCGFKKVFLIDKNVNFTLASEKLAGQLHVQPDGYITGGVKVLSTHFGNEIIDAIIGTDVIEHIYDLNDFFARIRLLNSSMVSVFTTASNPHNYFKVRKLKQIQLKDELQGDKPGEPALLSEMQLEPFLKIREQIIRTTGLALSEEEVTRLAKATRGHCKSRSGI